MSRIAPLSIAFALVAAACGGESPSAPASIAGARRDAVPHTDVRDLEDLGTFGWQHGFGFEINDRGEIAGRTDIGPPNAPTQTHAVFWSPRDGATDLGTLGGASSETRALNNHGLVVGVAQKPGTPSSSATPSSGACRSRGSRRSSWGRS